MEFAITAETDLATDWKQADDSWWPQGARSFVVFRAPAARDSFHEVTFETFSHCSVRRYRYAGPLRPARRRADSDGQRVSLRHAAHQSHRLPAARLHRTTHAESHAHFFRLADRHRSRIFRRLHHVLQFWLGDGQDAGRRRMA